MTERTGAIAALFAIAPAFFGCFAATAEGQNEPDAATPSAADASAIDAPPPSPDASVIASPDASPSPSPDASVIASPDASPSPSPDASASSPDAGTITFGSLVYEKITNNSIIDDLHRVRWHPSGQFALLLGTGGKVVRYDPGTGVALFTTLGQAVNDLDVDPAGNFFLVVGRNASGIGQLWRISVDMTMQLSAADELVLNLGEPVAIEANPSNDTWAIGLNAGVSISHVQLWKDGSGITNSKSYNASGDLTDLMWGDPALYSSDNVFLGHGASGSDSKTYVLSSDLVVGNSWPGSFGNAGGAGWRPGGGYGFFTGSSSNKLYVHAGSWTSHTLPNVGTAASPVAVGWASDGSRALIIGRAIGPGLSATVIDYQPGNNAAFSTSYLLKQSITNYDLTPWFGNSNMYLYGVDWRPGTACQEGLIVGSDNGSSFSPTFGMVIRYYDANDPDC